MKLDTQPFRLHHGYMGTFTIRIADDLHEQIKTAAGDDERSLNGEVAWLLRLGLDARKKGPGRSSTSAPPAAGGAR